MKETEIIKSQNKNILLIHINHDKKLIQIYTTNDYCVFKNKDAQTQEIINIYKPKKYSIFQFKNGHKDSVKIIEQLLLHKYQSLMA
jgi:hypothetical protein